MIVNVIIAPIILKIYMPLIHDRIYCILYLPKTKKFGCVGRGDLTLLFFSKVVK